MTIDSVERSVQDSAPSELYEFATPNKAWRYTSDRKDRIFLGQTYKKAPVKRSAPGSTTTAEAPQFVVTVPFDLDVVKQNAFYKMPPRWLYFTLWRGQTNLYTPYWDGYITSISLEGRWAQLLCPGLLGSALATQIPTVGYHQMCAHALYDRRCTVNKNAHMFSTKVGTFNALNSINVSSVNGNVDQWYRAGMIQRVVDGEYRFIEDQVGTKITFDAPFPELNSLDDIILYDGCNHSIYDCRDKYNNVINFGGTPYIPSLNMFKGQLRSLV